METYIITFSALPGKENIIADYYTSLEPEYAAAKGFRGRQIYQSRPGVMVEHVKKNMSAEEMAKHPAESGHEDESTMFVIIEQWDSIDDRWAFSRSQDKGRAASLFPNLKPEHTHEYYHDISVK